MIKKLSYLFVNVICFSLAWADLPAGFVYLQDIDPTIIQNLRYTASENFIGKPIDGYQGAKVILTKAAAEALAQVQKELLSEGFSLVVYDAYRPQRAVDHFMRWSKDVQDQKMKSQYYPRVDKEKVFELGYVAEKSGHSRGSTVDLTIIPVNQKLQQIVEESRTLQDGFTVRFLNDGTVDMGTSFDLFDVASHHDSPVIAAAYMEKRNYLRAKMKKHGFKEYQEEWWHYTLVNEPFPNTYFNFEVK